MTLLSNYEQQIGVAMNRILSQERMRNVVKDDTLAQVRRFAKEAPQQPRRQRHEAMAAKILAGLLSNPEQGKSDRFVEAAWRMAEEILIRGDEAYGTEDYLG